MIKIIDSNKMGKSEQGWLHSTFHFSFAEYYNPQNMNFGPLRVVNDDVFDAGHGFDTHPHKNMEIISYVIDGVLTHKDSMNNEKELQRGQVQYMSAGTGVYHSEFNLTENPLRFLQIWILPDQNGYKPNYGDYRFEWQDRVNQWLLIAGHDQAPITIHQDMKISVVSLDANKTIDYKLDSDRQAYLIQIEGDGLLNGKALKMRDAAEIVDDVIQLQAISDSHYILFDMKKEQ